MVHTLLALQVPQYVLEDYIEMGKGAQCNIICTQPRRLSAIGLADRVSKERSQAVGETVLNFNPWISAAACLLTLLLGIIFCGLLSCAAGICLWVAFHRN